MYQYVSIYYLFSPSGKLVQIEYALAAVAAGAPSVGIKGTTGIYHNMYIPTTSRQALMVLYSDTILFRNRYKLKQKMWCNIVREI